MLINQPNVVECSLKIQDKLGGYRGTGQKSLLLYIRFFQKKSSNFDSLESELDMSTTLSLVYELFYITLITHHDRSNYLQNHKVVQFLKNKILLRLMCL